MTHHLGGITEVAAILGVSRQRAHAIIAAYADFPTPAAETARGRVWETEAVRRWAEAHPDRKPGRRRGTDR